MKHFSGLCCYSYCVIFQHPIGPKPRLLTCNLHVGHVNFLIQIVNKLKFLVRFCLRYINLTSYNDCILKPSNSQLFLPKKFVFFFKQKNKSTAVGTNPTSLKVVWSFLQSLQNSQGDNWARGSRTFRGAEHVPLRTHIFPFNYVADLLDVF